MTPKIVDAAHAGVPEQARHAAAATEKKRGRFIFAAPRLDDEAIMIYGRSVTGMLAAMLPMMADFDMAIRGRDDAPRSRHVQTAISIVDGGMNTFSRG